MFYSQERARWDWTFDFMPPPRVSSQQAAVEAEAWPPPPLQLQWRRVASAFRGCRLYEAEFPTMVPRAVHDALPHESRYAACQDSAFVFASVWRPRDCQQPRCQQARVSVSALA
jgi:hypothetical protein